MSPYQAWLKQMQWQARRGNLETDVLLQAFIQQLAQQTEEPLLIPQLSGLLAQEDDVLLAWLMQPECAPIDYQALIRRIRKNYLNSKA